MTTELQTVLAISERGFTVGVGDAFEIDGVPYTPGPVSLSLDDWQLEIVGQAGGGSIDIENEEFIKFILPKSLKIIVSDLADMFGLQYNVLYPAGTYYSERWGDSRLVLQNAANPSGTNSIMMSFDEVGEDFDNETVILRGFAPVSSYEIDNDRTAYKAEIRSFPVARKDDLKAFLYKNGHGLAETLSLYGMEFKVSSSTDLNLNMKLYSGITDHYSYKNLKQFDIGFIESV